MKIAYFQCTAGISGDMILGALVDSGLKLETLKSELMKLNLPFDLRSRHVLKNGIKGTKVQVVVNEGHVHRNLNDIKSIVQKSGFKGKVKENIIKIFTNLAEAEAKVHGTSVEAVHFHEVGAMDSIIDICGAAAGLDLLGIEKIYCSPIHIGTGFTKCAHGIIPLPAPAVVQLLHGMTDQVGAGVADDLHALLVLCGDDAQRSVVIDHVAGIDLHAVHGAGDGGLGQARTNGLGNVHDADRVFELTDAAVWESDVDHGVHQRSRPAGRAGNNANRRDFTGFTEFWAIKKRHDGACIRAVAEISSGRW